MAASPGSTHGPTGWFRRSALAGARSRWRRARARCGWPMRTVTRSWRSTLAAGYPAGPFGWKILRAGWRPGSARCGSPSRWRTNWSGSIRSAERSWPRSGSAPAPGRSRRAAARCGWSTRWTGRSRGWTPRATPCPRPCRSGTRRPRSQPARAASGLPTKAAGALVSVDPRTGTVRRRDTIGAAPAAVTLLGQTPWVAAGAPAGREHRGGTLRVEYSAIQVLDPADPNDVHPAIWRATGDGLVALAQASGAAQLVPDLATAVPVPTDGGRTYVFRLRPGNPLLDRRAGPRLRPAPRARAAVRHEQPGRPLLLGPARSGGMHAAARCLRPVARGHHRRPDRHHHPPPDPPRPGPAVQADAAGGEAGAARNPPRAPGHPADPLHRALPGRPAHPRPAAAARPQPAFPRVVPGGPARRLPRPHRHPDGQQPQPPGPGGPATARPTWRSRSGP